jgi:hypothetical protein
MTLANLIMLGIGILALVGGGVVLAASARGTESQRYARRIVGAMAASLGMALIVFAVGLKGVKS